MTVTSDAPTSTSADAHEEPVESVTTGAGSSEIRLPVTHWSTAQIHDALESGDLSDWRAIVHAVKRDPYGRTARQVEEVLESGDLDGISTALHAILTRARTDLADSEREQGAREIRDLVAASGLRHTEFASRIGVSREELTSYLDGDSSPTVAMLVRIRRVARRFGRARGAD